MWQFSRPHAEAALSSSGACPLSHAISLSSCTRLKHGLHFSAVIERDQDRVS